MKEEAKEITIVAPDLLRQEKDNWGFELRLYKGHDGERFFELWGPGNIGYNNMIYFDEHCLGIIKKLINKYSDEKGKNE